MTAEVRDDVAVSSSLAALTMAKEAKKTSKTCFLVYYLLIYDTVLKSLLRDAKPSPSPDTYQISGNCSP